MKIFKTAFLCTFASSLLLSGTARADLLLGNMDAPDDTVSPRAFRIGKPPGAPLAAFGIFRVSFGSPSVPYIFEDVKLRLDRPPGLPPADPYVSLWIDNGTSGNQLVVRLDEDRELEPGTSTYTFTTDQNIVIQPDTNYFLVVSHLSPNPYFYGWVWSQPWTDPAGAATFQNVRKFDRVNLVWQAPIPPRPKFEINGAPDDDGDGVPNALDACPNSILTDTVIIDGFDTGIANPVFPDGCTIADLVEACADDAKNHGQFVKCVVSLAKDLVANGSITEDEKSDLISAAAQSDIGKK
ncbi:MAG: hypothetical protein CMO55_25185 [Verrucomicrobiales bacterium]|nr:hypothetical protein [Verrucomicrobiales bacterium]